MSLLLILLQTISKIPAIKLGGTHLCRWIAYIGKPIFVDTLVTAPAYSLVEQSLNSKYSYRSDGSILATNGDGFGLGWYMYKEEPGLFKTAEPAWANENINEICAQTQGHIFMAHVRAASMGSIQRTNAHPFKYKNWLFQHNGSLVEFDQVRRDLQFAIAPEYFAYLKGTTDSETLFLLALTFGLQADPKAAWEKVITHIRDLCSQKKLPFNLVLSCALSDGKKLYTIRYASGSLVHSQYYSTHADCMKDINQESAAVPASSVVIVSEPLDSSMEHWKEMPVGSFASIAKGKITIEQLNLG